MPQASTTPQPQSNGAEGPGTPSDAASAFEKALLAAMKASPADTADPRVSAAFALGWQMAELYRPQLRHKIEAAPEDLPGLGSLGDDQRTTILVNQIEAALAKLSALISGAGLARPRLKRCRRRLPDHEHSCGGRAGRARASARRSHGDRLQAW